MTPFLTFILVVAAALAVLAAQVTTSLAQAQPQPRPHVFILFANPAAGRTLAGALTTLGYALVPVDCSERNAACSTTAALDSRDTTSGVHSFSLLPCGYAQLHSAAVKDAQFILPAAAETGSDRQAQAGSWQGQLQSFLQRRSLTGAAPADCAVEEARLRSILAVTGADVQHKLLTIDLDAQEATMGGKWEKLCAFLGLGYSAVERLRLVKRTLG